MYNLDKSSRLSAAVELIFLILILGWITSFAYPFFFKSLTNNIREIATYNADSQSILSTVEQTLDSTPFEVNFFEYGHFYFNISVGLALLYSLFGRLDEWTIFFILRLVSLLGAGLALSIVYLFARRFLGRLEAGFAACLFAFSPAVVVSGVDVHPDSWQMAFLTLSLYLCARAVASPEVDSVAVDGYRRQGGFGLVLAAAAAGGAAFGTKYLGVLLLPLLAAAGLMMPIASRTDRAIARELRSIAWLAAGAGVVLAIAGYELDLPYLFELFPAWTLVDQKLWIPVVRLIRWTCFAASGICIAVASAYALGLNSRRYRACIISIGRLVAITAMFIVGFVAVSPWSVYGLQFVPNVVMQSVRTGVGDSFGLQWVPFLFGSPREDGNFVGWPAGLLSAIGGLLLLSALARRQFSGPRLPFAFILGFVGIFVVFLILHVNRVTVIYGLPAVPGLVLLAASGLFEFRMAVTRRFGYRTGSSAAVALAALIGATQIWHGARTLGAYQKSALIEALTPENKMLGDWLLHCVSATERIMAAPYGYVPPDFGSVVFGQSYSQLKEFNPDVVIVNKHELRLFVASAEHAALDPYEHVPDTSGFFEEIMRSPRWRLEVEFGRFQVYRPTATSHKVDDGCQ